MAATGSEMGKSMPVQGNFTLLQLYPCLNLYHCQYLQKIKKPQTVTLACAFWMAEFSTLQKELAQPVWRLAFLSWPWATSYLVSISIGAAAMSHIRDMIQFKITYVWCSVVLTQVCSSFQFSRRLHRYLCWQRGKEAVWKWKQGSKYTKKADNCFWQQC